MKNRLLDPRQLKCFEINNHGKATVVFNRHVERLIRFTWKGSISRYVVTDDKPLRRAGRAKIVS